MNELINNLNAALDEMITDANERMDAVDKKVELMCKDNPELLLRYRSAMFHADEWIKSHPFQCPPDFGYFLK